MPMLPIPDTALTRFDAVLHKRAVAPALRADFKKWLRYFLDFCSKYPGPDIRSDRLRPDDFCEPPIADPHDGWCG
jgi:hypothetical protein